MIFPSLNLVSCFQYVLMIYLSSTTPLSSGIPLVWEYRAPRHIAGNHPSIESVMLHRYLKKYRRAEVHTHIYIYILYYIYICNIYVYVIYIYICNIYICNIYIYVIYIYIYVIYIYTYHTYTQHPTSPVNHVLFSQLPMT